MWLISESFGFFLVAQPVLTKPNTARKELAGMSDKHWLFPCRSWEIWRGKHWKGCGDAVAAGLCTCPAVCVACVTRLSLTPVHLCLLDGWTETGCSAMCAQDYFKSLHYSSDETHAGKVLVFGLPTCAQHSHTEEWTQECGHKRPVIQRSWTEKGKYERSSEQTIFYYEHLFSGTVSHSHNHQLEPGFLINAAGSSWNYTAFTRELSKQPRVRTEQWGFAISVQSTNTSQININSLLHCAGCWPDWEISKVDNPADI